MNQHFQSIHCGQCLGSQDFCWWAVGVGQALLQQQQVIAVTSGQVEVVQNHQHRCTASGEVAHGLQNGVLVQRCW
ncbi:hypothetical protein D3C81_2298580 [compost metagenome]